MKSQNHIENPDVILIGSGIMSATLGAVLKEMNPSLRIQLYEMTDNFAAEASNGWHNAGTGHAGLCELSYTPNYGADGEVDVAKAIEIYHQFEHSLQFWGYAARTGMIDSVKDFINPVPHLSFVYGQEQVDFLRSRHRQMTKHHFFKEMEYTEDRDTIRQWSPLILDGRDENEPVAMTRMPYGTDVNFGALAGKLIEWLGKQEGCGYATKHRITDLNKRDGKWELEIKDLNTNKSFTNTAKFVFIGAGGGSLPLLQKSGIDEAKGFGGFPIGGQWLISEKPELVEQHTAKVYGMSPGAAPTMAVPHLDTRIIDGKKALLFGPYASWTTKFLHEEGSALDLPGSIRFDNIGSLIKVGLHNIPLVRYLVQQGTQSMETRLGELRNFYPGAKAEDWKLIDAGIRVQAIKKEDGDAGIVHFGTEMVTSADCSLTALLGASPGASVSTNVIVQIVQKCFSHELKTEEGHKRMKAIIPSYDENLIEPQLAERQAALSREAMQSLNLLS
ncbi:malate dehydrogenase (quinone) [Coraliomargarita sp. SDUM461003]|uniref:Probable malate:quinone oxidoreductase n=1 Tax=Thalassobacterium maritimum TaxID=3041265 RepID=A0ABU1AW24_9BACT|nr:malate dehydrogenase (quinone) [Coraliomargarita sp. SDUM461003]MDQ8208347.1 malate dehydrogenase (quinone) [Coraliomargarita sp. SDUM461003]